MVEILRIKGFKLNDNDKIVNSILKRVEKNNGECPCSANTSEDKHCPCSSYREGRGCCCGLYRYVPHTSGEFHNIMDNSEGD